MWNLAFWVVGNTKLQGHIGAREVGAYFFLRVLGFPQVPFLTTCSSDDRYRSNVLFSEAWLGNGATCTGFLSLRVMERRPPKSFSIMMDLLVPQREVTETASRAGNLAVGALYEGRLLPPQSPPVC